MYVCMYINCNLVTNWTALPTYENKFLTGCSRFFMSAAQQKVIKVQHERCENRQTKELTLCEHVCIIHHVSSC